MKCPINKMSYLRNVISMKCSIYEMSFYEIPNTTYLFVTTGWFKTIFLEMNVFNVLYWRNSLVHIDVPED